MSLPSSSGAPHGLVEEAAVADFFRLEGEIGRGATGRVYKAEDLVSGQTVAIKKIPLGLTAAAQQSNLQALMGEIDLLKSLNHQNIVQCLGSFRTRTHLYIVLEYMEKGSLASIIKQGVKLNEELVSVYVAQVLQGLRYLHAQGVVHRDIKGANILTNKQGVVKLADFGVSARLGELELHQGGLQQHVAGSPYWMAPEVIEMDQTVTAASDIWSVGCLVVEALTGAPPYFDLQPMSALFRIVADQQPPLPSTISPLMHSFLMQCFNKDPPQRPSAEQLLQHEWITERRQTLRRTWRGFSSLRSRLGSPVAEDSVSTVVNQDLQGRAQQSPQPSPVASPSGSFAKRGSGAGQGGPAPAGEAASAAPHLQLQGEAASAGGSVESTGSPSPSPSILPHAVPGPGPGPGSGPGSGTGQRLGQGPASAGGAWEEFQQSSTPSEAETHAPTGPSASLASALSAASSASAAFIGEAVSTSGREPTHLPKAVSLRAVGSETALASPRIEEPAEELALPSERSASQPDMTRPESVSSAAPPSLDLTECHTPPEPGPTGGPSEDSSDASIYSDSLQHHVPGPGSLTKALTSRLLSGASPPARKLYEGANGYLADDSPLQRRSLPVASGRQRVRPRNPHALVYDRLFKHADRNGDGRLTGIEAAPFFERSGLPRDVLFKVWELADSRKRGFLDNSGFYTAMDAISLAQMGFALHKQNWDLVHSREGGCPVPQLRGFGPDGSPDGSQAADTSAPADVTTAHFMSAPSFHSARSVVDAGSMSLWGKAMGSKKVESKPVPFTACTSITDGLREVYLRKLKPIEDAFRFSHFYTSSMHPADFDAKPCVLLLGQYSTGKTSFIKYLLGRDYPGAHVGPEPTTDRFVVVHQGMEDRRTTGDMLAVRKDLPYQGLTGFGTGFLSRLEGSQCHSPLLDEVMLVDTPGLLSGDKQRKDCSYDILEVCRWFASHSDLILLFFDPDKLDISDELHQVIRAIRVHSDKVLVVLNKASQVQPIQLMRVHGALMWGLGRAFNCPEVARVCVSSFSSDPAIQKERARHPLERTVFEPDEQELLQALYECPKRSCERKVNDLLLRLRSCKVHLLLIDHLRKQLASPMLMGLGPKKGMKRLLDDLHMHFIQVQRQHHLPIGDFPDLHQFSQVLSTFDLPSFPKVTPPMIKQIDDAINIDIPSLVKRFNNPWPEHGKA